MTTSPFRGRKPARIPKPSSRQGVGQDGHLGLKPLVPPALPENAVQVDPSHFKPSVNVDDSSRTLDKEGFVPEASVEDQTWRQQEENVGVQGYENWHEEQQEVQLEPVWDGQIDDGETHALDGDAGFYETPAHVSEEEEFHTAAVEEVISQPITEPELTAAGTRRTFLRRQEAKPQLQETEKKSGFLGLRRRRQEAAQIPMEPEAPVDEAGLLVDTAALARSNYLEQNQGPVFAAPEVSQAISLEPGEGRLVASGIAKSFGKRRILKDMGLGVAQGEVVGLLGPNGAGKTTSFYIVCGLLKPDAGQVSINGITATNLPVYRRARLGLGYLPQEASIFRGMNVEQNILSVLETRYFSSRKRWERLNALLDDFSIQHIRKSPALALSGGERRRVEIARALAANPTFILLDEPFAGVDPIAVGDIRNLVSQLKNRGIGVLITDHNVRDTLSVVDRAYIIFDGQVLKQGTPAEIVADERVRQVYLGDQFSL